MRAQWVLKSRKSQRIIQWKRFALLILGKEVGDKTRLAALRSLSRVLCTLTRGLPIIHFDNIVYSLLRKTLSRVLALS